MTRTLSVYLVTRPVRKPQITPETFFFGLEKKKTIKENLILSSTYQHVNAPINVPPRATTKNWVAPFITWVTSRFSTPISLYFSDIWYNTTVTASFNKDSPNTTMYNISLTWISSNTANTATGSTAEIRDENRNISKTGVSTPKTPSKPHPHKEAPVGFKWLFKVKFYLSMNNNFINFKLRSLPMHAVLKIVPTIAWKRNIFLWNFY